MKANGQRVGIQGARVLVGAGIQVLLWTGPAQAQPVPLPYRSQAPFLPTIDLFGGPNKGLILGAEEVDRGRPAPVTIGNTTFFPQVRRAGELYGGFTRVNGDLEILHGDLYLGGQAVGATLQQNESSLNSLSVGAAQAQQSIQQLNQSVTTLDQTTQQQSTLLQQHGTALQDHQGSLNSLSVGAAQAQQSIQQLNQSVTTLDQTTQQQSTLLQQHGTALTQQSATLLQQGAAITGLSTEMQDVKQSITVLDQNLNSLGNGVAGATALASALASLPVDAVQSPLSCGVGSGGYSDRYALAMGCAVHLASSLSLNAGGAYLFGGSSSYGGGSLSDVAGRFGLTYRFGARDDQPTRTAQAQRKLEQDLKTVKDENRALQSMLMALQRRVDLLHAAAAKP
ncbi:YadA-like family protein [Vulcanococcus sp.]|jgi:uncharacterized phage infection (PIP) family protein YhgE|uniref:YadA-like family protein n=1 Tax=Vulcanococcus sp. TaxID=2856995 RepID=UPI0037D9EAD5